jgi:hypothetical protein
MFAAVRCNENVISVLFDSGKEYIIWRVLYSGIKYGEVIWKSTEVSEEHVASIFRVE